MTLDDDVRDAAWECWEWHRGLLMCDDPERHLGCRAVDTVLAGYDVWRRTPRLTTAQRDEIVFAFFDSVDSTIDQACHSPQTHGTECADATEHVLAGYAEAE